MTAPIIAKNAPEWAAPGKTVYIRTSRYGFSKYKAATVVRHTKTQIVVESTYDNGRTFTRNFYFSRSDLWAAVGTSDSWTSTTLVAEDHPGVAIAAMGTAREEARAKVRRAVGVGVDTVGQAEAAIQALSEFITTMHALDQKEA